MFNFYMQFADYAVFYNFCCCFLHTGNLIAESTTSRLFYGGMGGGGGGEGIERSLKPGSNDWETTAEKYCNSLIMYEKSLYYESTARKIREPEV